MAGLALFGETGRRRIRNYTYSTSTYSVWYPPYLSFSVSIYLLNKAYKIRTNIRLLCLKCYCCRTASVQITSLELEANKPRVTGPLVKSTTFCLQKTLSLLICFINTKQSGTQVTNQGWNMKWIWIIHELLTL